MGMMLRVLPLAVFLSSAATLAVELTIVRLAAPYVGQSLLPWSAAIASVLLGLTAGHVLGGLVAGPAPRVARLVAWLGAAWCAAGVSALAMPSLVWPIATALSSEHGFTTMTVLAIAALACPPSIAAGFSAPLAVRIASVCAVSRIPQTVGAIYAASALGSVLGTAAAGYLGLEMLGATWLARATAALWIALGLGILWPRLPARTFVAAAAAAGALLVLAWSGDAGPCLQESRYTCIRLLERPSPDGGLIRFMILDEGVHSASDRDQPRHLHLGYAVVADRLAARALAASTQPSALVIGGGGATLPRAWAAARPTGQVTSIELDAKVAALAGQAMWAGALPNLATIIGDGRAVMRGLPSAAYDVVLLDAYRTHSVPPHLVTQEFARQVAARLRDDGVFVSNIIDRAEQPLLALSIASTLATIFPAVDIWIGDHPAQAHTNLLVAAWKNPQRALRPADLRIAVTVMGAGEDPKVEHATWQRLDIEAATKRWPRRCGAVLTDDWAPVERLLSGREVC
jgi:spermidine synthase